MYVSNQGDTQREHGKRGTGVCDASRESGDAGYVAGALPHRDEGHLRDGARRAQELGKAKDLRAANVVQRACVGGWWGGVSARACSARGGGGVVGLNRIGTGLGQVGVERCAAAVLMTGSIGSLDEGHFAKCKCLQGLRWPAVAPQARR
eukprot:1271678-Pleurochrysis_carterae.AAC.3